jgi:hypothetical protein
LSVLSTVQLQSSQHQELHGASLWLDWVLLLCRNTLGTDESPLKQQLMAANKKLFYDKWRHVLQHHPAPGSDHSTACLRHYKGSVSIMNASEPRAVAKAFDLAKHGYMVTLTSAAVPSLSVTRHLQAAGVAVVQPSFMSTSMQSAA